LRIFHSLSQKNKVELNGILALKINSRKIVANNVVLDLAGPKFKPFSRAAESLDGQDGHNGINGASGNNNY
jgi:hypothetical protein